MVRPSFRDYLAATTGWVWARARSRRFWRFTAAVTVVGLLLVGYEASFRARLGSPESRLVTEMYTRPVERGGTESQTAIPLGAVDSDLDEFRIPVRLEDIPDQLRQAVLAVEDQRFYQHEGLDFRRIGGALVANIRHRAITQGGSTITQQLAKNLFLTHHRTPLRKIREAAFALALEERYSKDQILEAYLNEVYLGQTRSEAIHGVAAAAHYYFGKELGDLTLGESAILAGMIQAPNRYTPIRHPVTSRRRRDLVLNLMASQDRISKADAGSARRERIRARPHARTTVSAPWFRDYVLSHAGEQARGLAKRGGAVFTTLDVAMQVAANRAMKGGLPAVAPAGAQAALVAIDPRNGDILAMVGGSDYATSQFNRASEALRQPGSAFKPLVALAALGRSNGNPKFTLASVIRDEPLSISTAQGPWAPRNYDGEFHGPVTFREALEHSLNVPFVRIGLEVGPDRIVRTARDLGLTSALRPLPSLALGSSEVTLVELVRAYGVLAGGGYLAEPRLLFGTVNAKGELQRAASGLGTHPVEPAEAYLVTSALEGVIARGTGRALADLVPYGGLAGKTGTSNDWRDAWFIAYTPTLVVGVWVGFDDGRSLGLSGARAALPIAGRFLREVFERESPEQFQVPDGVVMVRTGAHSDGYASWDCGGEPEVFLEGTEPEDRCGSYEQPDVWSGALNAIRQRATQELIERLQEKAEELARRFGGRR
ncbi:MAG TPA: PBP1A family penicillin-binding protein [Gemmatimonadales bacterium]|nr:PBP1A family penicillin-binding protein [Gemmatimonadales bacterium]